MALNAQAGHATRSQFYEIVTPGGRHLLPPRGRCWVYNQVKMNQEIQNNNVWFGLDGNRVPRRKVFLSWASLGMTPDTLWLGSEVGTNDSAKKHLLKLFPDHAVFDTPKPEELIHRVLQISTNRNDLVLDTYLGSGTTAAVPHKMGRQYIRIEQGKHADNTLRLSIVLGCNW